DPSNGDRGGPRAVRDGFDVQRGHRQQLPQSATVKIKVVTLDGERIEYEVDPRSVGLLEFRVLGQDPDLPARHWLHEIQTLEVSEHPQPVTQTAEPAEYETVVVSKGELHYGRLKEFMRETDPTVDEVAYRFKRLKPSPAKVT